MQRFMIILGWVVIILFPLLAYAQPAIPPEAAGTVDNPPPAVAPATAVGADTAASPFSASPAPANTAAPAADAPVGTAPAEGAVVPPPPAPSNSEVAVSPFGAPTGGENAPADAAASVPNPFGGEATSTDTSSTGFSSEGSVTAVDPMTYWYEESTDENGGKFIQRNMYPFTEKKRKFDERVQSFMQTIQQQYPGDQLRTKGWDPRAMAEWMAYYEQLDFWQKHVEEFVLSKPLGAGVKDIPFDTLTGTTVKEQIESTYEDAKDIAKEETKAQEQKVAALIARLEDRKNQRLAYWDWKRDQQELFLEFAQRWLKQSEGIEINIDGNIYLISAKPLTAVPQNVVPVITTRLTPYDIFNEDGTLKRTQ